MSATCSSTLRRWVTWNDFELSALATVLAPKAELNTSAGSTAFGTPISGSTRDDDIAEDAVVPAFYAAAPLPGGLHAGLGVNVPYGLETQYSRDWVGRYHAVKSSSRRSTSTPAVAWRPGEVAERRAGFQAQYADGTLKQRDRFRHYWGVRASLPPHPGRPGQQDGYARLRGRRLGVSAGTPGADRRAAGRHPAGHRLPLGGRSHPLRGRRQFHRRPDAGVADFIPRRHRAAPSPDTDASLGLTTPASLSFGVHQTLTPRVAVMAEAQFTHWSVFDQLTIKFDNPAQPDSRHRGGVARHLVPGPRHHLPGDRRADAARRRRL